MRATVKTYTIAAFILVASVAVTGCGTGLAGAWETTAVPAETTSFSEYKQTLTLTSDNKFTRDIKATFASDSSNPGCIMTIVYEGTYTEPVGGQLRFVALTQKSSTATACANMSQNYLEDDKPVSGAAAVPEVVDYKLSGRTLDFLVAGKPWISYTRK